MSVPRVISIAVVLLLNFVGPCVAGVLNEAVAEYNKGDYAAAARLRRTLVAGQCFANVTYQPNAKKRDQSSSNLSGFTGFS